MAKPILFETISRIKYEALDAAKKLKNNYLIKEENGTTTKHIGGLEGGGSGNNDFVVTYTEDDGTYTADKTFAEITAAIAAGKNVRAVFDQTILYCVFINSLQINFTTSWCGSNSATINSIYHSDDEEINYYEQALTVQPL